MSPAGRRLWSAVPLPKPLIYPRFPLGLSRCPGLGIVALGTWKMRDLSCVWPPVRRDYPGSIQTLDPERRPVGGFPIMPLVPLAGTWGGALIGAEVVTH